MEEITLIVLLVGNVSVGKTCLLLRYVDDLFSDKYISSVGVEYRIKEFEYNNYKIKLQVWDTAGQERFHAITKNYFHNTDGIFFIYDITCQNSFEGVKKWITESEELGNNFEKLLLGNKCDEIDKRAVPQEDAKKYADEKKIDFFEVSAKDNINLKEAFEKIVSLLLKNKTKEEIMELYGPKLNNTNSSEEPGRKRNKIFCC